MVKKYRRKATQQTGGLAQFDQIDPTGVKSSEQYIDLLAARPDPNQPRQLMPTPIAARLAAGESPIKVLRAWGEYANNSGIGFQEERYASIFELADSIEDAGLINAIQVQETGASSGVRFQVITGERRWWAHVLLHGEGRTLPAGEKEIPAARIRATIVPASAAVAALQYRENRDRADVSAIEEAYAIDAYRTELKARGQKASARRMGEELGIAHSQISRFLRLLKLPAEVQEAAKAYGLSEAHLRPIEELRDVPALQVEVMQQVIGTLDAEGSLTRAQIRQIVAELTGEGAQSGVGGAGKGKKGSVKKGGAKTAVSGEMLLDDFDRLIVWLRESSPTMAERLATERSGELSERLAQVEAIIRDLLDGA